MRRSFLLLLPLAACVPPAPPPAAPPPPPVAAHAPPPPPAAADWRDRPRTPGDWAYARDGSGSRASYRPGGATLACGPDRRVRLAVEGRAPGPLTVRTSTASRTLAPGPDGAVTLDPRDPLLDAMAFSRGRFALEQPGHPPLSLPSWAEVGRVVEDCRG